MFPEHHDLCSTCEHVRTCGGRSTPAKPIFSCERYVECVSACLRNGLQAARQHGGDSGRLDGLCAGCEMRETCKFPRPEGGVWHCTEFE